MKILGIDRRKNSVRAVVETSDDLWTLYLVITPGDLVRARTVREIKFGDRGSGRSSRIPMVLTIKVVDVEFQPFTTRLRIRGVVIEGPEKYGVKGKHHTLSIGIGSELEIVKPAGWPGPLLDKLRSRYTPLKLLIVAIDYDEYAVALLEHQGLRIIAEGSLHLPGKDDPFREQRLREALTVIAKTVVESLSTHNPFAVIIAGPGFVKESLAEKIKELASSIRIHVENVSMGGEAGVQEAIRRGIARRIASELAVVKAQEFFEEFDKLLAKNPEYVSYGIDDVLYAVESGAAETVIVLDELLHSLNEEEREKAKRVLQGAEETRAHIIFVNTQSEPGIRLKMLGGIAAIHRYPLPRTSAE